MREDLESFNRGREHDDSVTVDTVKEILKQTKDSAPGPDGLQYHHISELDDEKLGKVVDEFNKSIETANVPEDWLHSYLKPLPKPGKDHKKLNGYRIITMQNVNGKLIEKIVARRLSSELEKKVSYLGYKAATDQERIQL